MASKIDYKNTFFQITVGLLAYFLFIRKSEPVKKAVVTVGDVSADGADYDAIYFKDSEYFKNFPVPQNYLKNWNKLKRVLDLIRIKFGSAVIIYKGYNISSSGIITDTFQTCQSVEIYPQNGKVKDLKIVIDAMVKSGEIVLIENIFDKNNKFRITVNG